MGRLHSDFKLHLEIYILPSTKRAEDEEGLAEIFAATLQFYDFSGFPKKNKRYFTENLHVFTGVPWRFLEAQLPNLPLASAPPVPLAWISQYRAERNRGGLKKSMTVEKPRPPHAEGTFYSATFSSFQAAQARKCKIFQGRSWVVSILVHLLRYQFSPNQPRIWPLELLVLQSS